MSAGTRSTLLSANHPAPSGGCGHARNQAEPLTDADVLGVTGIPREERPSLVSGPTHGPHHPPSLSLGRPPRSRQQTARPLGAVDLGGGNTVSLCSVSRAHAQSPGTVVTAANAHTHPSRRDVTRGHTSANTAA